MQLFYKVLTIFAIATLVSVTTTAQQTKGSKAADYAPSVTPDSGGSTPGFQQRYPRYKLRPGDTFDVVFELSPEFNQTITVQPDGFISLKGVGDIHISGKTVPELTATLHQAYGSILNNPLISVMPKDFERPYFTADGQLQKPGKYELRGDTTLTEAIAMAGGFLDNAKHSQVLLFRRVDDEWTSATVFNVKEMHNKKSLKEDPYLRPGDMLFVPKNRVSKIKSIIPTSSVGAVVRPY